MQACHNVSVKKPKVFKSVQSQRATTIFQKCRIQRATTIVFFFFFLFFFFSLDIAKHDSTSFYYINLECKQIIDTCSSHLHCDHTLDLILTTLPGQFQDVHSADKLNDHDIVSGTLKIFIPPIKKSRRKVYLSQKGDYESMRKDTLEFAKEKYLSGHSDTRSV